MSINGRYWCALSNIPNTESLVVRNRSKDFSLVRRETDVLDFCGVAAENLCGFNGIVELVWFLHVPQANQFIVRPRNQMPFSQRTPSKTVAFSLVASELERRFYFVVFGLAGVFEVIEDVDLPANGLGCDHIIALGHTPRSVYFSLVIYLRLNFYPLFLLSGLVIPRTLRKVLHVL